jgi:two-component system, LytTR family, response regulator
MKEPIRVVIVDDEKLAREGVRGLLAAEPDMLVVGECGDGRTALETLRREKVDVVLLDIQMPEMTGFDVITELGEENLPVIIFLTAFDQHAIAAFDAHALDYIVKPFTDARFRKAVARARDQVHQRRLGRATTQLASLVASLQSNAQSDPMQARSTRYLARVPVRSVGRTAYLRVQDIVWIAAADYYAELHTTDGRTHLVRETLQSLESRLDPARFLRVHRSTIVSLDHVAEILTDQAERHFVVLRGGVRLPLGRSRREALEQALARR